MPIIPFITPGGVNADFSTARQSGNTSRTDSREIQDAFRQVGASISAGPRFVMPRYDGLVDLGKGVQQLGNHIADVRIRNQQVTDTRLGMEGETHLKLSEDALSIKLRQEKDPLKWEGIATEHVANAIAGLNTEGMSEQAKAHLMEAFVPRWRSEQVTKATLNGMIRNESEMRSAALARVEIAKQQRDPASMRQVLNTLVDQHAMTEDEATSHFMSNVAEMGSALAKETEMRVNLALNDPRGPQVATARAILEDVRFTGGADKVRLDPVQSDYLHQKVQQAEVESTVRDMIAVDPAGVLLEFDKPDSTLNKMGITPAQAQKLQDMAFERVQQNSSQTVVVAADDLQSGVLKTPEQLNTSPRYSKLTPSAKAKVFAALTNSGKNDKAEWLSFATDKISSLPVTGDAVKDTQTRSELEADIHLRFDGPLQAGLLKLVDEHFSPNTRGAVSMALSTVDHAFKTGVLGNYVVPYQEPTNKTDWKELVRLGFDWTEVYKKISTGKPDISIRVPGTPLTPADQAALGTTDRKGNPLIFQGKPVVDASLYESAQKRYETIRLTLMEMAKRGATDQQIMQYAEDAARTVPLQSISTQPNPQTPAEKLRNDALRILNPTK